MGNSWHYIQDTIKDKLQRSIGSKYETFDDKLHRLTQQQSINPKQHNTFFPTVVTNKIYSSCRRACCCCNKNNSSNKRICCKPHCICCMPRSGTSTQYRTTSRHCEGLSRSCHQKPFGGRRKRIRTGFRIRFRPRIRFQIRRATEVVRAVATWVGESAGGFGNSYSSVYSSGRNMSSDS